MINNLKQLIKSSRILSALILPFYDQSILYSFYKFFNKPFFLNIADCRGIRLMPKGQITKGIFSGWFEENELLLFRKFLRPGMNIVDAGANIGLYSIIAGKICGDNGNVVSFEPSKETFSLLCNNIKLNKLNNINAYNLGLGDTVNEKLYLRQDIGKGDAERYLLPNNKIHSIAERLSNTEEITVDTLDNILDIIGLNHVDFIKIDTEGFEYYILKGALKTIINNSQIIIMMECTHDGTKRANTTQAQVISFLKGLGLNIYFRDHKLGVWSNNEAGAMISPDGMLWACREINQLTSVVN